MIKVRIYNTSALLNKKNSIPELISEYEGIPEKFLH